MLPEADLSGPVEPAPTWKEQHLNAALLPWVARGWQVASVSGDYATLIRRSRNGWFNVLAVLITCGLWLIYVVYRVMNPTVDTVVLKVDDFGNIRCVSQNFGW